MAGVNIFSGTDNAVLGNRIYSNGGLGINLDTRGVTGNDPNDTDGGANNKQNFPVLDYALTDGRGHLTVKGSLDTDQLNQDYRIELFTTSVDEVNGHPGHELKYDGRKLMASYLRVGTHSDGTWRVYKVRQDYVAAKD